MITAVRNEKYITRNISQFKKIQPSTMRAPESYEDDSDISDDEGDEEPEPEMPDDDAPTPTHPTIPAPGVPAVPTSQPLRRYPARQRKTLHRYGQNVYEQ